MKLAPKISLIVAFLLLVGGTVQGFRVPNAEAFREPSLARIVFWHLPAAIVGASLTLLSAYFAIRWFLKPAARIHFYRLQATWEIAAMLAIVGLVTGIIFSKAQWGAWWHWDPRQTSFLMVVLLLGAGQLLYQGLGEETRERALAGYSLMTLLPTLFLTFVYPRLPQVQQASFHPSQTVSNNGFDSAHRSVLGLIMLGLIAYVYSIGTARVVRAQRQDDPNYGTSDSSLHSANSVLPESRPIRPEAITQESLEDAAPRS